ncbi:MAG: hypothetical protein HZB43_12750 [candidate division Zixibacteria bacterium]|nr:hypothetical protein [candidate division Zixibacteria bacterium]
MKDSVTLFDRGRFSGAGQFIQFGTGSLGAKANGLVRVSRVLSEEVATQFRPAIEIDIPRLGVIATDWFEQFVKRNGLHATVRGMDDDKRVAAAFRKAALPEELISDLRLFLAHFQCPLAVRSSSLLEDAIHEPLAGVYATRFVPNNDADEESRVAKLVSAIKQVYASALMAKARLLLQNLPHRAVDEKMAVIIQEVVGTQHGHRFYPHISGVARSFNFYPLGLSKPEDGMAQLALGLGKIIGEDGIGWSFSLSCPQASPPYGELSELVEQSQREFWAIDLRSPVSEEASGEAEHLQKLSLSQAEEDGTLAFTASTYRAEDDKVVMGIVGHDPRILDFGQILRAGLLPLPELLRECLDRCEEELGAMVEIEFAVTFPDPDPTPARFRFLQVRPMVATSDKIEVAAEDFESRDAVVASDSALGNGKNESIRDIIYVRPQTFDPSRTREIVHELETLNRTLKDADIPYVLIGFGRWGSSDPSAGIPVNFGQVAGARVIVESTLPCIDFMPSQGSHFFHNITCSRVLYFSVRHGGAHQIDWAWLDQCPSAAETQFLRHIRLPSKLTVKVDGRTNRGVILR